MSDLAQCSAKLHSVVSKHLHCLLEVDIESLKFHIQQKELLDIGESDQVWDTTRPCRERMKQLIHFACRKVNYHNGLHRFETFIRCLVESGHRDLSDALTADLNGKIWNTSHCCLRIQHIIFIYIYIYIYIYIAQDYARTCIYIIQIYTTVYIP